MERKHVIAGLGLSAATVSLALAYYYHRECARSSAREQELQKVLEDREKALKAQEDTISHLKQLRQDERNGRIALETKLRREKQEKEAQSGYVYQSIATVESPFVDRRGTPRQPRLVPAALALIRFHKAYPLDFYQELQQFSHIFVLFVFHENTNIGKEGLEHAHSVKAKIRPPRLHGESVGCLSTRSPHRPNNLGLSVCQVERVCAQGVWVRGADMVHGTPVLDVKPYLPYDAVRSSYALPMVPGSEQERAARDELRVPQWVVDWDVPARSVSFAPDALRQLEAAVAQGGMRFCEDAAQARQLLEQVLRQDIRGLGSRSRAEQAQLRYVCRLDRLVAAFLTLAEDIQVVEVALEQSAAV